MINVKEQICDSVYVKAYNNIDIVVSFTVSNVVNEKIHSCWYFINENIYIEVNKKIDL